MPSRLLTRASPCSSAVPSRTRAAPRIGRLETRMARFRALHMYTRALSQWAIKVAQKHEFIPARPNETVTRVERAENSQRLTINTRPRGPKISLHCRRGTQVIDRHNWELYLPDVPAGGLQFFGRSKAQVPSRLPRPATPLANRSLPDPEGGFAPTTPRPPPSSQGGGGQRTRTIEVLPSLISFDESLLHAQLASVIEMN